MSHMLLDHDLAFLFNCFLMRIQMRRHKHLLWKL